VKTAPEDRRRAEEVGGTAEDRTLQTSSIGTIGLTGKNSEKLFESAPDALLIDYGGQNDKPPDVRWHRIPG